MKQDGVRGGQKIDEYLLSLQKEYICLGIRQKIYQMEDDKAYFDGLIAKKREKIISVSKKYGIGNIFSNPYEYRKLYEEIVPDFGFPELVYNIVHVEEKQLTFPYKGTVVTCETPDSYLIGVSKKVDFPKDTVLIKLANGSETECPFKSVRRLSHRETDEFYYHYPEVEFRIRGKDGVFIMKHYDMKRGAAYLEGADGKIEMAFKNDLKREL